MMLKALSGLLFKKSLMSFLKQVIIKIALLNRAVLFTGKKINTSFTIMKKFITLSAFAALASLLAGCAGSYPKGSFITDITVPLAVTDIPAKTDSLKVGKSQCKDFFSLVAFGDASINAAMKNANISKVYYVDWKAYNVLGLTGTYECTVYGE